MATKGFRERVLEVAEDGAALASSVTQTSLLPTIRKIAAIPLGYFDVLGRVVAFDISGRISTVVTTPGTLQLALRFGSIDVFLSGLMALNVVAQTNVHWHLRGELICRAIGATTVTTLFPKSCTFDSHAVVGSPAPTAGGAGRHMLPYNAAPAVGNGFDNGAAQLIDVMAQWSVSNAANSIQLHCASVDLYN